MYRQEMEGSKITKFEERFLKRQQENEFRLLEKRRKSKFLQSVGRNQPVLQLVTDVNQPALKIQLQGSNLSEKEKSKRQKRKTMREVFNSYRVNDYAIEVPPRVTFEDQTRGISFADGHEVSRQSSFYFGGTRQSQGFTRELGSPGLKQLPPTV